MNAKEARITTDKALIQTSKKKWSNLLNDIKLSAELGWNNTFIVDYEPEFIDKLSLMGYTVEIENRSNAMRGNFTIIKISW